MIRSVMSVLLVVTLWFSLSTSAMAQAQNPNPATPTSIGPWKAWFENGAISLDYQGIPFARGGQLQLFAPNYAQGYYSSAAHPPDVSVTPQPDGSLTYRADFHYDATNRRFNGVQQITVSPNGTIRAALQAKWQDTAPALIEWNPLRIWAYLLVGSTQNWVTRDGQQGQQSISYFPVPWRSAQIPFLRSIFTHTAIGEIELAYQADEGVCFDARSDPYLEGEPVFWCGLLGSTLSPGETFNETLTLKVVPSPTLPALQTAKRSETLSLKRIDSQQAQVGPQPLTDAQGHPILVPQPKRVEFTQSDYPIPKKLPLYLYLPHTKDGERVHQALNELAHEWASEDIHFTVSHGTWENRGLLVAVADRPLPIQAPIPPVVPESYALEVTPTAVMVVGRDAAGAFYGLQTLRQLLQRNKAGQPTLPQVSISDWPTLAFRGAHLFVGKEALPFHEKLIDRVFSRLKLNRMVIECEYTAWKSHPELHVPFAMSPHDLAKEVAFCRDHFMEPIPLIETLGHAQWLFANNQHKDLAEDVNTPYAYNVNDQRTYRIVFDIFNEAISLFHPHLFHIGHDEVTLFGKYPARPKNQQDGLVKLFVADTKRLHDWLAKRDIRTMIWSDMLLNPLEGTPTPQNPSLSAANAPTIADAQAMRAALPKDIIICDWRYAPGSEQRNGLALFQKDGFQAIGSAWYEPENIWGWAQQVLQNRSLGTLQTTWAGYNSNESLLSEDFPQFSAFVLAAEYAWSGTNLKPLLPGQSPNDTTLPYTASELFTRLYGDLPAPGVTRPGWFISLSSAANIQLAEGDNGLPWQTVLTPSQASNPDVNDPKTGILYANDGRGILLRGLYTAGSHLTPTSLNIPVDRPAHTIAILSALTCDIGLGKVAASLIVAYTDGTNITIPLRSGYEIAALSDLIPSRSYFASTIPYSIGAHTVALRLFRWRNPYPHKVIRSLTFRAENPFAGPILFSITGVE